METPPPIAPSARPKVLIVSAVIAIVFGIFGLLGSIPALLLMAGMKMPANDPVSAAMLADPTMQAFQKWGGLLGALAGVVLLAGGIGLLKCREWARKAVIGWSVYSMFATAIGSYITIVHMVPLIDKAMKENVKQMGQGAEVGAKIGTIAATGGAIVGLLFSIGLAIALIIMLTRPRAKAACQGKLLA